MDEQRQKRMQDVIAQAVSETIENMAFMVVEPLETCPEAQADMLRAALLVLEPRPAELRLEIPLATAKALARALYNLDEQDITEGMLHDLAGELLNTITGKIMKQVLPPETPFQLGLPEIGPDAFLDSELALTSCAFTIDGNPLCIMAGEELLTE